MLEIPQRFVEMFKKLLFDFDYFVHAMLNGGLVGVIGITILVWMIANLSSDSKKRKNEI